MKAWICDDEPKVMEALERMLREEGVEDISSTTSWKHLLDALRDEDELPDVVFLDIVFNDTACVQPGNVIHAEYPGVQLVFITGHLEYSPDIFDAAPLYLLKKPFDAERLHAALQAAIKARKKNDETFLTIKNRGEVHRIPLDEIEYIESDRRKLTLHGQHGELEWYGKLSILCQQLPEYFAQPHQSYCVNMKRIRELRSDSVRMFSGAAIPVAQQRRQKFRNDFVLFTAKEANSLDENC